MSRVPGKRSADIWSVYPESIRGWSQTCSLPAGPTQGISASSRTAAECNSAIQQTTGLRYKFLAPAAALAVLLSPGCVSKSKADAQARAAFAAGAQQAMQQMQARGPNVTVIGPVKNNLVPWTAGLTLAQAVLAADYFGKTDPKQIVIRRNAEQIPVDPKQLLSGEDIPLEPRDVIEIKP